MCKAPDIEELISVICDLSKRIHDKTQSAPTWIELTPPVLLALLDTDDGLVSDGTLTPLGIQYVLEHCPAFGSEDEIREWLKTDQLVHLTSCPDQEA